jgi:glucose/arabinose dehydrogenase
MIRFASWFHEYTFKCIYADASALTLALALAACGGGGGANSAASPAPTPTPQALGTLNFPVTASGFSAPLGIAHAGDGSGRLFIVEQGGKIIILKSGAKLATPLLDISAKVSAGGERGLLGLAFPPNFAAKKHFYVNYTRAGDGASVVARYRVSSNPDVADAASEQILLTVAQPFSNHNGGHLLFGPDGLLYIGLGDGGAGGDPDQRSQNPNELLGKMLRIDVESGANPYAIPTGNAFPGGAGGRAEIWALGLRNPWRYSFDRQSGDLYIGDVGQVAREEISVLAASSAGGANFGWDVLEGELCFEPASNCTPPANYVPPVATYARSSSCASVTGGHVYRGPGNVALQGVYLYADYCDGRIWGLKRKGATWQNDLLADTDFAISSFGEDEAGNVYFVDLSSGELRQIGL